MSNSAVLGDAQVSTDEISVRNVSKRYTMRNGRTFSALKNVNLSIGKGEFVSLCGPSGCGKTTLLKILSGLIPYEAGDVIRAGERVSGPSSSAAMVFQQPELLPWRTILKNVLVSAELAGRPAREYVSRAKDLLDLVGLGAVANKYPHELSGGMQQRTAIARALLLEPAILFMDEPFGALDAMTREVLNIELLRIWSHTNSTVVFVTHSIPEAVLLSDRVVVMTPGPDSGIGADIAVPLDRPRSLDAMGTAEFGSIATEVRHVLHGSKATTSSGASSAFH